MPSTRQTAVPTPTGRLDALQSLRGIAAAMVVLAHAIDNHAEWIRTAAEPLLRQIDPGEFGVKLFFCISGFIICYTTRAQEGGPAAAAGFIRRRLARLVPMWWIALALYAARLAQKGAPPSVEELLMSMFFIPYSEAGGLMRPVLGVGWSLNYEMMFYVAFAVALAVAGRARLVAVSSALGLLVLARQLQWLAPTPGVMTDGIGHALYLLSAPYLLFFIAGLWLEAGMHRLQHRRPLRWSFVSAIAVLALLFAAWVVMLESGWVPAHLKSSFEFVIGTALVTVAVVPVVRRPAGGALSSLAGKALLAAGDASYSTYLLHGFIIGPAARALAASGLAIGPLSFAAAMIVVATAIGMISYRLIEKPLLRVLDPRPVTIRRRKLPVRQTARA